MRGEARPAGPAFMHASCLGDVADPVLPDSDVKIEVNTQAGKGDRPNLTLLACRGGQQIGHCRSYSMGEYCQATEA